VAAVVFVAVVVVVVSAARKVSCSCCSCPMFAAFHGSMKGMRLKCEDECAGKLAKTLKRD